MMVTRLNKLFLFGFVFFVFIFHPASLFSELKKVIVFDFGNVIAKTDSTPIKDFISDTFQISDKETTALMKQWDKMNRKNGMGLPFWLNFAASRGITLPREWQEQFVNRWQKSIHVIPGMLELVEELRENGYQTAMLSNTTPFHAEMIASLGLYDYFCPVLLSYQIGASKPQKKAYEILLQTLKRPASDCLFIDDKEGNVNAAKALGIDSIQFFSVEELRQEILKRGIYLTSSSLRFQKILDISFHNN